MPNPNTNQNTNNANDRQYGDNDPHTKHRANDVQYGGSYYKDKPIQPWDYIVSNNLGFLEGNAVKYLSRWREKNGIEDLKKAIHYIEKLIEIESAKLSKPIILYNTLEDGTVASERTIVGRDPNSGNITKWQP